MMTYNSLPASWGKISLTDDLIFVKTGVNKYDGEKEYFSTGSIQADSKSPVGSYTYLNRPSRANRISRDGDVFQARMKNTNKALLIDKTLDSKLFSTGFFQIRPDPQIINGRYIFYYLNSTIFHKAKDELCTGSTQEALNNTNAKNIIIPIPPIREQYRIVEKIEELFSEIDKGIEYLQIAKGQLEVYRQAVLKAAFEGKLTGVAEGNGWEKCTLNDFAVEIRTGPFGTLLKKSDHRNHGTPVIGIENICKGKFIGGNNIFVDKELAEKLAAYSVKADDVIISRSGTVGELCRVPPGWDSSLISSNLIKLSLDTRKVNPEYFVMLFQSKGIIYDQIKKLIKGSTRVFLNQKILKSIIFLIPSLEEQHLIVQEIESRLSVCEYMEETIAKRLAQAESLKQSILKKAFEGRLVPQNLDDEPAAILLKRIRKKKKKQKKA